MTAISKLAPAATPVAQAAARPILMTIANARIALDCSRSTVLRLVASGKLRSVTLSARAVRIVAADVDALIA